MTILFRVTKLCLVIIFIFCLFKGGCDGMCRKQDYKDMCKKTCQCRRKRKSSYDKKTKYSDSGYGKHRTAEYKKDNNESYEDKKGYTQEKSKAEKLKETVVHFKKFVNNFVDNYLKKKLEKIDY